MATFVTFTGPLQLFVITAVSDTVTVPSALTVTGRLVGTVTLNVAAATFTTTGVVPVPPAVVMFSPVAIAGMIQTAVNSITASIMDTIFFIAVFSLWMIFVV
jgi:hypothetical protein